MNLKMWATLRTLMFNKEKKKPKLSRKILNVNEEYLSAVRTESNADSFLKFQLIVDQLPEFLLEPGQEAISTILDSSSTFSCSSSCLKPLLADFFHVSAEASRFCTELLRDLNRVQSEFWFISRVIDGGAELSSSAVLSDPFAGQDFDHFHKQHATILQHLKSGRTRIARRIRLIKCFNRATGVCLAAACGLAAAAAAFLVIHTLTAAVVLMCPALLGLPRHPTRKKILNFSFLRYRILRNSAEQLDVAAKGAYILNRDFDTMSRLVGRVRDEIEHGKGLVLLCLERRRRRRSLPTEMVRELRRYEMGLRKHVEELEEHVHLCLVTINRARALVVKEIRGSCGEGSV